MAPNDDASDGSTRTLSSGSKDLDSLIDFARSISSTGLMSTSGASPTRLAGSGLPVGLTVPSIQLAHALSLLNKHPLPHGNEDSGAGHDPSDDGRIDDIAEARDLVADALFSLAVAAGVTVPTAPLSQPPSALTVDPEVEAAFVEFDLAREQWERVNGVTETQQPDPAVDRYFAAEEAVLALADGSPEVLRRQAGLLLGLADEVADQMGPSAANAIANVAQGLLLRLKS